MLIIWNSRLSFQHLADSYCFPVFLFFWLRPFSLSFQHLADSSCVFFFALWVPESPQGSPFGAGMGEIFNSGMGVGVPVPDPPRAHPYCLALIFSFCQTKTRFRMKVNGLMYWLKIKTFSFCRHLLWSLRRVKVWCRDSPYSVWHTFNNQTLKFAQILPTHFFDRNICTHKEKVLFF